jgi:hypothetical protein
MQRAAFTFHALEVIHLLGLDGRGGASSDGGGDFAHLVQVAVLDHRRLAVHAQDGDIRAVHGAAHVQAAGQGDAHLGRQLVGAEVIEQVVHHGFDHAGGVDGRGVAMHPALGVHDVGDAGAGAADGVRRARPGPFSGFQLGLVFHHELDVVTGGEPEDPVAVIVGDLAQAPRKYMVVISRVPAARTVYSLAPVSDSCISTPGSKMR